MHLKAPHCIVFCQFDRFAYDSWDEEPSSDIESSETEKSEKLTGNSIVQNTAKFINQKNQPVRKRKRSNSPDEPRKKRKFEQVLSNILLNTPQHQGFFYTYDKNCVILHF